MQMGIKMLKVKLKEIAVYHGKNVVSNDIYLKHFKERGKDVEHFLKDVVGRDKRYLIDKDKENSLTMALEASKEVLKKAKLKGTDIDMIVFSSQLPEFVVPPSSYLVHAEIGGKNDCICYDMNANCAGMTIAFEQVIKYMSVSPNVKRALIVGCDYVNLIVNPENELCYGHYGDAACAIILEQTNEDCGLVGSKYDVHTEDHPYIRFPGCGFSKLFDVKDKTELMLDWKPFVVRWEHIYAENMKEVIEKAGLTINDISMFCLSQYVYKTIKYFREVLGITADKSIYIGNKYGYTGTTSPFIALYEAINKGMVKRGDYILFWTVGAGSQNITILFKY